DDERYGEERQRDAAHQRGASENEPEEEPARRRRGGHRIVPAHEEVESGGEQAAERHLAHGNGGAEDVAGEDGQDGSGGEPDRRGEQTRRDRVDEEAGERTEERVHRPRRGEAVPEEPVRGAEDSRIAGREERGRLPEVPDVALAVRQMAGEEVVDAHVEEERGAHVGPEREGASQPDRERQHEDRRERQTAATPVPRFEEPRLLRCRRRAHGAQSRSPGVPVQDSGPSLTWSPLRRGGHQRQGGGLGPTLAVDAVREPRAARVCVGRRQAEPAHHGFLARRGIPTIALLDVFRSHFRATGTSGFYEWDDHWTPA